MDQESSDLLLVEHKPPIAWLKLNRPEVMNCLSKELLRQILQACIELSTDRQIRTVIIIGAGNKCFCAGADLKERKDMTQEQTLQYLQLIRDTMSAIESLPQVVIAAINGSCYGGGTELACSCDLRIMVEEANLRLTEVTLGIIPGAGGTQRLPRLIGKSLAKEMILAASPISAHRAYNIGLVHKLIPAATGSNDLFHKRLVEEAQSWALEISKAAPLSLRQAKYAIDKGCDLDLDSGLVIEKEAYLKLLSTKDRQEALQAFAQKRPPIFTGE